MIATAVTTAPIVQNSSYFTLDFAPKMPTGYANHANTNSLPMRRPFTMSSADSENSFTFASINSINSTLPGNSKSSALFITT